MIRPLHNLRLLLAVDMFSGQIRTPDMTVVDLVSDFQPVHAPDKTSVDSPPAKAAYRYINAFGIRKFLIRNL